MVWFDLIAVLIQSWSYFRYHVMGVMEWRKEPLPHLDQLTSTWWGMCFYITILNDVSAAFLTLCFLLTFSLGSDGLSTREAKALSSRCIYAHVEMLASSKSNYTLLPLYIPHITPQGERGKYIVMNEWMNEWVNEWMNEWMNEWTNEWKATKVHVHAHCFSVSFPALEDLLKFDTTAWNSYHWIIYCASAKVKS